MGSVTVSDAVRSRRSVRAFLDRPVDAALIRALLQQAARAPSGGNLQPWRLYVLAGEPLAQLKAAMRERTQKRPQPPVPEYSIYPAALGEPYRTQRYDVGEAMYGLLGIARDNKLGRLLWLRNNYEFFGAPLGLFCYVDRGMGPPQWADLGMYLQTLMLLLREHGLDSCAQEAWSIYHDTVAEHVQPPGSLMLFCGMAIGYADPEAEVNRLETPRMPLEEFAELRGL